MALGRAYFLLVIVSGLLSGQQYTISTVAGGLLSSSPTSAVSKSINEIEGIAVSSVGDVYFTSGSEDGKFLINCVLKVSSAGNMSPFAGICGPIQTAFNGGYSGEGGPATSAPLAGPWGVALDPSGNVYFADGINHCVHKVSLSGIISTAAGICTVGTSSGSGFSGDGGPATSAHLSYPHGIAIDSSGNLLIADSGNFRIRKVTPAGAISTIAGNGTSGESGDGGAALNASFASPPEYIAVDLAGNIYVSDPGGNRVRKITPNNIISTYAGTGTQGSSGDGGQAIAAQLAPSGLAVDSNGNLFVADDGEIRKITPSGLISNFAGNVALGSSFCPLAVDRSGNVYYYGRNTLGMISSSGNSVTTLAGNGNYSFSGDGGSATGAQLFAPEGVAVDPSGNVYVADSANSVIRIVATSGAISTVAGAGPLFTAPTVGDGGPALKANLVLPALLSLDAKNNLYVLDLTNQRIRRIDSSGTITTLAGNGPSGNTGDTGDGGLATNASLGGLAIPCGCGLAVDSNGNVFVSEKYTNRVRKISAAGIITTFVGTGQPGFSGDGSQSSSAQLNLPEGLAVDSAGNLYIADTENNRIRKVSINGVITTIAGTGVYGDAGDGSQAINAQLAFPGGLALDKSGNIYFIELGQSRIRKISTTGLITTIAGNGIAGFSGDGGPAISASLFLPTQLIVDTSGNVYVADTNNASIRVLRPGTAVSSINSVTNGASNISGPISPGEILTITGSGLGPAQLTEYQIGSSGTVPTQLAGTQVFFNGTAAPIIYAWATQVAAIVPYEVSGTAAQVTVSYQGQTTTAVSVPVSPSAPGIFSLDSTGRGAAAVVNQDGSINTAATPAKVGDYISIFATGEGQTKPFGSDGVIVTASSLTHPVLPVTITIGGQTVQPSYVGGAPGEVAGLLQINVQIPSGISTGSAVPISFQVGTASSQAGVTIAVR